MGEREVWRGIAEGLNAVIVNPSVILGYGDFSKGSAKIFSQVWEGLRYYTSGINGFVDVRDVVAIMLRLMESNICNERFIVSSENVPYKLLFEEIAHVLEKPLASIKAGKTISEFAWRMNWLKSKITGKDPLITKETARIANHISLYNNKKIREALSYDFIPVSQSIEYLGKLFLNEKHQSL
jgi:dihydroflavonol-4-reductase